MDRAVDKHTRLKLAVQKTGRLTDPSLELLARCGLKLSRGRDQLLGVGENLPLDVLFVRDDDIPDLVQEDVCDLGLVGLNVIEEKRLELAERGAPARFTTLRSLDFGHCRLALAVPAEHDYQGPRSLRGKRIATTYPYLLKRFLEQRQIEAEIVRLSGAVEMFGKGTIYFPAAKFPDQFYTLMDQAQQTDSIVASYPLCGQMEKVAYEDATVVPTLYADFISVSGPKLKNLKWNFANLPGPRFQDAWLEK